jgi:hypothetical protein
VYFKGKGGVKLAKYSLMVGNYDAVCSDVGKYIGCV